MSKMTILGMLGRLTEQVKDLTSHVSCTRNPQERKRSELALKEIRLSLVRAVDIADRACAALSSVT